MLQAYLYHKLSEFSPVLVRHAGNPLLYPARLYVEIRITNKETDPGVENRFNVIILIISTPSPTDNVYEYLDVANQFHDYLQALTLQVSAASCLVQDGPIKVEDFGFVDNAETIKQAIVMCQVILEY